MITSLTHLASVLSPALELWAPGTLWLVGGCLRDASLKKPLHDIDFSVQGDALCAAQTLARVFKKRAFPLDKERGTYRVVHAVDGARVTFDFSKMQGRDLTQDLARRDFSINALALPVEALFQKGMWQKHVIDLFGGTKDLKACRIRLISEKALQEDPLRLLRVFRFLAELGFSIEAKTLKAVKKHHKKLLRSAHERVRDELLKILSSPRSAKCFQEMDKAKLLCLLIPECEAMRKTAHVYYGKQGVLGHSLKAMEALDWMLGKLRFFFPQFYGPLSAFLKEAVGGYPRYSLVKFGLLLHDVGKPKTAEKTDGRLHFYGHDYVGSRMAVKIAARLRLSNEEKRVLSKLVHHHMRPGNLGHQPVLTDRAVYRFYRDLGQEAVAMLVMSLADHFTYLSDRVRKGIKDPVFLTIHKMLESHFLRHEKVVPPKLLDGHVLMNQLNLGEGKKIGALLRAIQEAQAEGKVKTKDDALTLARQFLKSVHCAF